MPVYLAGLLLIWMFSSLVSPIVTTWMMRWSELGTGWGER